MFSIAVSRRRSRTAERAGAVDTRDRDRSQSGPRLGLPRLGTWYESSSEESTLQSRREERRSVLNSDVGVSYANMFVPDHSTALCRAPWCICAHLIEEGRIGMAEGTTVKFTLTIWRDFVPPRPLAIDTHEDGRQVFDSDSGLQEQIYSWPVREDAFAGISDDQTRTELHDRLVNRLADSTPPSERRLEVLKEFIVASEKVIEARGVSCVQSESRSQENTNNEEERDRIEVNSLLALVIHLKWVVACFSHRPGISVSVR